MWALCDYSDEHLKLMQDHMGLVLTLCAVVVTGPPSTVRHALQLWSASGRGLRHSSSSTHTYNGALYAIERASWRSNQRSIAYYSCF